MNPRTWGRGLWMLVFCIIFKYKNNHSKLEHVKQVVYTICTNLPCKNCINHYVENAQKTNILNCRTFDEFLMFHINIYNEHHVNKITY